MTPIHQREYRTSDAADDLAEVVLRELVVHPEADILEAGGKFGVGLEAGAEVCTAELLQEPLVATPKQPVHRNCPLLFNAYWYNVAPLSEYSPERE